MERNGVLKLFYFYSYVRNVLKTLINSIVNNEVVLLYCYFIVKSKERSKHLFFFKLSFCN